MERATNIAIGDHRHEERIVINSNPDYSGPEYLGSQAKLKTNMQCPLPTRKRRSPLPEPVVNERDEVEDEMSLKSLSQALLTTTERNAVASYGRLVPVMR